MDSKILLILFNFDSNTFCLRNIVTTPPPLLTVQAVLIQEVAHQNRKHHAAHAAARKRYSISQSFTAIEVLAHNDDAGTVYQTRGHAYNEQKRGVS